MACRTTRPKRDLLRIVRGPDGVVTVDQTGRVAGRGAYVCRETACLERAFSTGALGRALATRLPDDMRTTLSETLTQTNQPT